MDFHSKYLKYKNKYLDLKKKLELSRGGATREMFGEYGDHVAKSIIQGPEKEEKKIKDQFDEIENKFDEIDNKFELKNKIMNKITEIFNEIILESIKPQKSNDSTIKILEALTKDQPDNNEISLLLRYSLFIKKSILKGVKPNINKIKNFVDSIENFYNNSLPNNESIDQKINEDITKDKYQQNYSFINLNKTKKLYYSNFIKLFNEWQEKNKVVTDYLSVIKNKYPNPKSRSIFPFIKPY
jgi:hypothetical protein